MHRLLHPVEFLEEVGETRNLINFIWDSEIHTQDFTIEHIDEDNDFIGECIYLHPDHDLDIKFLNYHYYKIFSI